MEMYYIVDKQGKIITEIKCYVKPPVPLYFIHSLAHTFDVKVEQVLPQAEYDKKNGIYRCTCCQINPVNALDGYDTCDDCVGKL